jgi:endo-1,4-beta-xylanase
MKQRRDRQSHQAVGRQSSEPVATRGILLIFSLILGALGALGAGCAIGAREMAVPQLVVSPAVDTLRGIGATVQLTASMRGPAAPCPTASISWTSLNGGVATVDSLGTVRAVAAGTALIVAACAGRADTATLLVLTLERLDLAPPTVTLSPTGTIRFAVSGTWTDGSSTDPDVTYASTGGTITADGLYTAGATPGTFAVIATEQGGSLADTSTVTVTVSPPTLTQLVLTPASVTLAPGGTNQWVVSGTWSDGSSTVPAVTYSATGGTITAGGLYTAGTTPGTFQVIATQQGGPRADTSSVTVTAVSAPTLRLLASARNFAIGAAVRDTPFTREPLYRQTLATQYNSIVAEDATDFWPIHPGPSQYAFGRADSLVAFAQANGMAMHGHSLVWYSWNPTWVTNGGYTSDQLRAILKDHITTVVGRYKGKIVSWDVVNEPIEESGNGLHSSFWMDHLGPEYIDSAFVWAHRADPAAKLYLNEWATETIGPKSNAILALAQALKGRGVPIDGVGFQMHLSHFWPHPTSEQMQTNLIRFSNAGFDIRITELDSDIADTAGTAALIEQAVVYRNVLDACLRTPRCLEVTTWGFTDKYHWVPQQFPGYGRALPFDANYQPKPAFDSLIVRLGRP